MKRFFDGETLLWKPLGVLGELVILSLLWGACCVPLVTAGAATAALYDCAARCVRQKDDGLFSRFFEVFKREFKTGTLATLLWALLLALPLGIWLLLGPRLSGSPAGRALGIGAAVLLFLLAAALVWVFPTLSRFTFGVGGLTGTAFRLAFSNILRSVALVLLCFAVLFLSLRYVSPVMFCPGVAAWLSTFLIEPVFRKYEQ